MRYSLFMQKIIRPFDYDMESLLKCFRRVSVDSPLPSLSSYSDQTFFDAKEESALFALKEAKRVYAGAIISHDVAASFFTKTNSQRKADDLLDRFSWNGEPLIVIRLLFVDPGLQRKGFGSMLLKDLYARYKDASFLLSVEKENESALRFFLKMGFINLGECLFEYPVAEQRYFLVKPFSPQGLCREAHW